MKGKNLEIPKGTEITAYVVADTAINLPDPPPTKSSTGQSAPTDATATPTSGDSTESAVVAVLVKSDPSGAEILVDDKFMGTTQSTLKLTAGEHTITIVKPGHKQWKRTITLNVGSEITLDAVLEKVPQP